MLAVVSAASIRWEMMPGAGPGRGGRGAGGSPMRRVRLLLVKTMATGQGGVCASAEEGSVPIGPGGGPRPVYHAQVLNDQACAIFRYAGSPG
jgi:hypothetical protein